MREEINYWKLNLINVAGGGDSSIVNKLTWAEGVEQMVKLVKLVELIDHLTIVLTFTSNRLSLKECFSSFLEY